MHELETRERHLTKLLGKIGRTGGRILGAGARLGFMIACHAMLSVFFSVKPGEHHVNGPKPCAARHRPPRGLVLLVAQAGVAEVGEAGDGYECRFEHNLDVFIHRNIL